MLGIILLALLLLTLGAMLFPFLRRKVDTDPARMDCDVVVYRNQLAEIDQDIERGLMSTEQAAAARTEIHRRMLAAEDAETKISGRLYPQDNRRMRFVIAGVIAATMIFGSVFLYLMLGAPELPGKPYADRQKLVEAVETYRQALQRDPKNAEIWTDLGETLAMASDGLVVPQAMEAFIRALELNPQDPRAQFYIGLAESQIGNLKKAVAIWRNLERDSAADATYLPLLQEHIAAYAREGKFDPLSVPPEPPPLAALKQALATMAGSNDTQ